MRDSPAERQQDGADNAPQSGSRLTPAPVTAGRDLTRGPLTGHLLALAGPMALSFLLQTLYNLVDAFWLGKLGPQALVAPTITMNVMFIGIGLAMGVGAGGTTLVSQYRGAGRLERMRRAGGQTLLLLIGGGLLLAVAGELAARPLLRLLQTPADAFDDTLVYLRWLLAAAPFLFGYFVYHGIHTGLGDTIGPLQVTAVSVALNLALDPLLIFGLGPLPRLGVAGAASATLLARALAAGLGLRRLLAGERGLKLRAADIRLDRRMSARVLRIGVPLSAGQMATALGFTLLLGVVNTFGSDVTAAFGIGNRIVMMVIVPAMAMAQAAAAAVGQNLGGEQPERAQKAVRTAILLVGALLLPLTALTFFLGAPISRLFVDSPPVIAYGRELFRINSPSVLAFGMIMILLGAFQGAGHTVPVMVLNVGRLWLLRIPLAYLLALHLGRGPGGIWWAMAFSNVVTAVGAALWFRHGGWQRRRIVSARR
jgi:putative MATE family efflux protein